MEKNFLKYYIAIAYFCSTVLLFAQTGPGSDGDGSGGLEGTDPAAPIDEYVWVLGLIGLVYVFLRVRAFQNKKIQG